MGALLSQVFPEGVETFATACIDGETPAGSDTTAQVSPVSSEQSAL